MNILHTVLSAFPKVLTGRIQAFLQLLIISFILVALMCDSVALTQAKGIIGKREFLRMSAVATSYLHDFVSPCQGRTFYTIRQRTAIYKIPLRLSA